MKLIPGILTHKQVTREHMCKEKPQIPNKNNMVPITKIQWKSLQEFGTPTGIQYVAMFTSGYTLPTTEGNEKLPDMPYT